MFKKSFQSTLYLKQKRLRNVNVISAKNLKIDANRFNVWFTLHFSNNDPAFFISSKLENERNPKWNLFNLNKLAVKEFVIRIWYSNFDIDVSSSVSSTLPKHSSQTPSRLNLFLEMSVNLDALYILYEDNTNYLLKSVNNLIIFDMFGLHFSEKLFNSDLVRYKEEISEFQKQARTSQLQNSQKNSYKLSVMIRLHDFQRVIHETNLKTTQLKINCQNKFNASSRVRQLQWQRDEKLQRIELLKQTLLNSEHRINELHNHNKKISHFSLKTKQNAVNLTSKCEDVREKCAHLQQSIQNLTKENQLLNSSIKLRQRQLICDLANIFQITQIRHYERQNENEQFQYKIVNSILKYTNNFQTEEQQETATALGHIVQALQILSEILSIPLRHPVVFLSSKSYVIEQFSEYDMREYALFKQNTIQDESFPYAVSLINRNLSQLRIMFDYYKNLNPNDTLNNLKWIFDFFK
jgi:hypothetical protein